MLAIQEQALKGRELRAAVLLRDVVSTVDRFPVLTGVNLDVATGEILLVSGANGAGKTSLLRLLAGMLPVTAGRAVVLDADLTHDRRSHRRRVALVAQESFCYDDLSVRRNLTLHATASGEGVAAAARAMTLLELGDVADVAHGRLSTGQRRRCALAVALSRRADLLLLDEPHAGLDEHARDLVDSAVREAAGRGATVVLASHELARARALADREVVIAGGSI